ncbi:MULTISPECIES: hypothetical protein [Micrococcus]|uniref:hypothetical protein n=1 Tax=Micrococcus TaxID=1269 RepID=UPI0024AFE8B8|nr:hypothetical protein [Micrococcus yunnanensis]WHM16716.1 hypothetical protein QL063_00600 [Micrococcus yunnanensis]
MKTRRAYTAAGMAAFLSELQRRHGAPAQTGTRVGVHPAPQETPPLTAADGTPEHPLPTTTPED